MLVLGRVGMLELNKKSGHLEYCFCLCIFHSPFLESQNYIHACCQSVFLGQCVGLEWRRPRGDGLGRGC